MCHGVSSKFSTAMPKKTISVTVTQLIGCFRIAVLSSRITARRTSVASGFFNAYGSNFENEKTTQRHQKDGDPIRGRP
jgi:hypothetical protein